jgi:hypothetical protein
MEYKKISYKFYVQSPEDFYKQLRAFERNDHLNELEIDTDDLTLAKNMLESIGVNVNGK